MGRCEYHVVMTALHQPVGLPIEPLIQAEPVALRACAMPAGVVPVPLVMRIRALLHVAAEFCGAALHQRACGLAYMCGQVVRAQVRRKNCFEYRLNRGMHIRFLIRYADPQLIGLVQPVFDGTKTAP